MLVLISMNSDLSLRFVNHKRFRVTEAALNGSKKSKVKELCRCSVRVQRLSLSSDSIEAAG